MSFSSVRGDCFRQYGPRLALLPVAQERLAGVEGQGNPDENKADGPGRGKGFAVDINADQKLQGRGYILHQPQRCQCKSPGSRGKGQQRDGRDDARSD